MLSCRDCPQSRKTWTTSSVCSRWLLQWIGKHNLWHPVCKLLIQSTQPFRKIRACTIANIFLKKWIFIMLRFPSGAVFVNYEKQNARAYPYANINIWTHTYTHTHTHPLTRTYILLYTYNHTYKHTINARKQHRTHVHLRTHTRTTHTCTHAHIYTRRHTFKTQEILQYQL